MTNKPKKITHTWSCETCKNEKVYTTEELLQHLEMSHQIIKPVKGTRTPLTFADGAGFFMQVHNWTLGDEQNPVHLQETVSGPR